MVGKNVAHGIEAAESGGYLWLLLRRRIGMSVKSVRWSWEGWDGRVAAVASLGMGVGLWRTAGAWLRHAAEITYLATKGRAVASIGA